MFNNNTVNSIFSVLVLLLCFVFYLYYYMVNLVCLNNYTVYLNITVKLIKFSIMELPLEENRN